MWGKTANRNRFSKNNRVKILHFDVVTQLFSGIIYVKRIAKWAEWCFFLRTQTFSTDRVERSVPAV